MRLNFNLSPKMLIPGGLAALALAASGCGGGNSEHKRFGNALGMDLAAFYQAGINPSYDNSLFDTFQADRYTTITVGADESVLDPIVEGAKALSGNPNDFRSRALIECAAAAIGVSRSYKTVPEFNGFVLDSLQELAELDEESRQPLSGGYSPAFMPSRHNIVYDDDPYGQAMLQDENQGYQRIGRNCVNTLVTYHRPLIFPVSLKSQNP